MPGGRGVPGRRAQGVWAVDKLKDINVKHVIVIVAFLAAITVVVVSGKSEATLVIVGLAVLGGLGLVAARQEATKQETTVVREQTNGVQARYLAIIEAQGRLLAQMQLPPELLGTLGYPIVPDLLAAIEPTKGDAGDAA